MAIISNNPILRAVAHLLIPAILLYALYVQFHGEYGPGGGFQAGVIFSVGLVLYTLVYGTQRMAEFITLRRAEKIAASGILLYIATGIASLLGGGNFLDYSALSQDVVRGQHIGIFLIELGVGITIVGIATLVFCLMMEQVDDSS